MRKLLWLSSVVMLAGCGVQGELRATNQSSTSLTTKADYIVSSASAFGGRLESTARASGDAVRYLNDGAGFAVINTANPGAYSKVADTVVRDLKINMEQVKFELADESQDAIGNPPTSGATDPRFNLQWGHDAVNAPEAWNAGQFGAGVRVAVLDAGIDHDHPDLAPNINASLSRSFMTGIDSDWRIRPGLYFNHGTHVAGTIAAAMNSFGVIGVAPKAEIVAVKVCTEYGTSCSTAAILSGIVYAGSINADVINMSLGGLLPKRGYVDDNGTPNDPSDDFKVGANEIAAYLNAEKRTVQYARSRGSTIIASAGNSAVDFDHTADLVSVPSMQPGVITIAATAPIGWAKNFSTSLDVPTSYTNHGQSAIQFAAPGGDSEYPGNDNCTVAGVPRACWVFDLVFSTVSGGWGWAGGTSMAAPHASGIAALIISEARTNGKSLTPAQVEAAMKARSVDLGKPGNDDFYGAGRVSSGY